MNASAQTVLPTLLLAIITLLTVTLYWQGLSGPFLLDDANNVLRHLLAEWRFDAFIESVFRNDSGPLGRPIPVASFIFSGLLHGNSEWGFKYHNLLLHLLIGVTCYVLVVKLSLIAGFEEYKSHWTAVLSTSLWLLHPLHVSTTLYAVQRMAQFSCLFVLCTLIAYTYGRASSSINKKLLCYGVLIPVFSLAGLFSKENAALIPLFILALELFLVAHLSRQRTDKIAVWCFAFTPLVVGSLAFLVFSDRFLDFTDRTFTLQERVLTQIDVVFLYLQQVALPRLASMGLFLDDQPIRTAMGIIAWSKLVTLISLLGLGTYLLTRGALVGFGIVFFFVGHAMESTIIPLEITFEHRNYLPSVGLILAITLAVMATPIARALQFLVAALYVALFAGMLYARTDTWTSEESIYVTSVLDHPNSVRARVTLANYYMEKGSFDEAMDHIRAAQQVQPDESGLINMEVLVRCNNEFIADEIYDTALNAFKNNPLSVYGLRTLSVLADLHRKGRCPALNREKVELLIEAALSRAINVSPDKSIIQYLYLLKARFKYWSDASEEAILNITEAFNHRKNPQILFEMLEMLFDLNRLDSVEHILFRIENENLINSTSNRYHIKRYTQRLEEQRASQNDTKLLDHNTVQE